MASTIENISKLTDAGVLAARNSKSHALHFRRYNLIYGFNGSGKSTLSRLFASLEAGKKADGLPAECEFEFQLSDGAKHGHPSNCGGLERRVAVFNTDFVEKNLQWSVGRANPVFYIGREQAELATKIEELEETLPAAQQRVVSAEAVAGAKDKAFIDFKRDLARLVSRELRLQNRKYEAPQLVQDFEKLNLSDSAQLEEQDLESAVATCRLDAPLPILHELLCRTEGINEAARQARTLAAQTPGAIVIREIEQHPEMLLWVKAGHEYHAKHDLGSCLFCGNTITPARRELLEQALDDRLQRFLALVEESHADAETVLRELGKLRAELPAPEHVSADLRGAIQAAQAALRAAINDAEEFVAEAVKVLAEKKAKPAQAADTSTLRAEPAVAEKALSLEHALEQLNQLLREHNQRVESFAEHQEAARLAVRRHYAAVGHDDYREREAQRNTAVEEARAAADAERKLREEIEALRSDIQEHGPAAERINKLIQSYLGHGELTISAIKEGYEIHRHGQPIEGAPSEGERTAIALCYFMSTLEAEGRTFKDLIVVVDDPISSLDTRALNFVCAMVRNALSKAAQLFIMTHNQHCMNEFKKAWKRLAKPDDPDKKPTATLLFLDVSIPTGEAARTSKFTEMSKLLREYDSEYHYLFDHVLKFEAAGDGPYDYAYMMPNVLRRVLDVFLAFRCPGSAGLSNKIDQLCAAYPELNRDRLNALDRLAQVESHSDSLEDLITFSSMVVEESRDANVALLAMMEVVDSNHLAGLRRLCR